MKKLSNELIEGLEEIIEHFRHYKYIVKFITKEIHKLGDEVFKGFLDLIN